jgi:hypothetical protein
MRVTETAKNSMQLMRGTFKYFKSARRDRCVYHNMVHTYYIIVQKMWEMFSPKNSCFAKPELSDPLTSALKRWMDGSNCSTYNQYEFSKDLLLQALETNEDLENIIGKDQCQHIRHWMNTKVLPLKNCAVSYQKRYERCFDDLPTYDVISVMTS